MNEIEIETPRWFVPLLDDARYKGVYGGRGSGKSHAMAEYVVERCLMAKTDVVCIREVQKSLSMSVKKLIEDKIESFGVGSLFEVQRDKIITPNGGVIVFSGMQNHTAESIKSLEGFDIAWVEEAQSLSQRSLDLLRPTIRKEGSEILFTWNPNQETDPVDRFLRGSEVYPGSIVVQANYKDNPWLPDVLRNEMEYDKRRDPDKYAHIWLGKYRQNSNARVFHNWTVEEFERPPGTIHRLGADWGFSVDPSVLVRCDIDGKRLYVDHEAYMVGCEIDALPALFMSVPEAEKWPIVADSARPETISYMRKHGFPKIMSAVKGARSLEEGVEFLKSFDIVVHPRCTHLIDELTLYSYKTDPLDESKILPILADKDNHCLVAGTMVETMAGSKPIELIEVSDRVLTRSGYKRVTFAGVTDVNRSVVRVVTSAGEVVCTPDHKVYTSNKGFIRADALSYNDEVLTLIESAQCQKLTNTKARFTDAILKAREGLIASISSGLSLAGRHGFTVKFGRTLTGRFLLGITSITRTGTPITMALKTLNACRQRVTLENMSGLLSATHHKSGCLIASGHSLRLGTQAQKALRSTEKLERRHTSSLFHRLNCALSVALASCRKNLAMLICFVQTNAKLRSVGRPALMTSSVNANSAELFSPAINIASKRFAPALVLTVTEAGTADKVYDLTVEDQHEFFANGVLVHNCIDALRYACEGARRSIGRKIIPSTPRANTHSGATSWMG